MWKAINDENHPFKIQKPKLIEGMHQTRSLTIGVPKESAISDITKRTFINDGIKAWNMAPNDVKKCVTFESAKKAIKTFVKTLPF